MTGQPADAASFFDGRSAVDRQPPVAIGGDAIAIEPADGAGPARWPLYTLERDWHYHPAGHLALASPASPGAQLVLRDAGSMERLRALCPGLFQRPPIGPAEYRQIAAVAATVLVLLVTAFYLLPWAASALAAYMPRSWEDGIGDRIEQSIAARHAQCVHPAAAAQFYHLHARLTPDMLPDDLVRLRFFDLPQANAFAFPGRRVLITKKMLDQAGSPEEIAAILAHEIGHVRLRHVARRYVGERLLSIALSPVFGLDVAGSYVEGVARAGLAIGYTRDQEREADAFAVAALNAAGISPAGAVATFERMAEAAGASGFSPLSLFSTHPEFAERAAMFQAEGTGTGPAMSPDAWREAREMCQRTVAPR